MHLSVSETSLCQYERSKGHEKGVTHFFPIQFLGPLEKGMKTSKLSLSNLASSPNHLSGINEFGSVKFLLDR